MDPKEVFYSWFPAFLRLPVLLFLFFVMLTANGIFPGNITYMYNGMGTWPEHMNFAYNSLFIGVSMGLMLEGRLKQRLSGKGMLIFGLLGMLVMNAVCATTSNPFIVAAACFLLGIMKVAAFTEIFLVWLFIWSPDKQPGRVYPFLYAVVLAGSGIMNWMITILAGIFNWRLSYTLILLLLLVCLLIVLLCIRHHPLKRIIPLYQMDRAGFFFLSSSMMLLNYVLAYGALKDWFYDRSLQWSASGALIAFLLFIRRELLARHPFIPPALFQVGNLGKGLLFFFVVGIFTPAPVQIIFTSVLRLEPMRIAELNLYTIPGIMVAAIVCFLWYYQRLNTMYLILSGFTAMAIHQWLLYTGLSPDFPLSGFWWSSIAKGYGTTTLFIAYGLYTISNFEPARIMTVAGLMVLVRSFVTSALFTAIQTYWMLVLRQRYFLQLTAGLPGSISAPQRQYYMDQATLVAAKELTG
jgi:MFS transporter, DHA2 family, multidrug resistance protein